MACVFFGQRLSGRPAFPMRSGGFLSFIGAPGVWVGRSATRRAAGSARSSGRAVFIGNVERRTRLGVSGCGIPEREASDAVWCDAAFLLRPVHPSVVNDAVDSEVCFGGQRKDPLPSIPLTVGPTYIFGFGWLPHPHGVCGCALAGCGVFFGGSTTAFLVVSMSGLLCLPREGSATVEHPAYRSPFAAAVSYRTLRQSGIFSPCQNTLLKS